MDSLVCLRQRSVPILDQFCPKLYLKKPLPVRSKNVFISGPRRWLDTIQTLSNYDGRNVSVNRVFSLSPNDLKIFLEMYDRRRRRWRARLMMKTTEE